MGKSFIEAGGEGWGPFTFLSKKEDRKAAKDAGKLAIQSDAQSFEQQRILAHDERQAAAMENLRAKIVSKLREVEAVALAAAEQMERARQLASKLELQGDPILAEADEQIADMERAVVQVQAGTVVDAASFDTHALAVSYTDAQAALIAMTAIRNRAAGVATALGKRYSQIQAEALRAQELQRQQAKQAEIERQRQIKQQRQDEERRKRDAEEQQRRQRLANIRLSMDLDDQIRAERRALSRLQNLLNARKQQADEVFQNRLALSALRQA